MPQAPQRLKILFLSPRFPYPTHGGDRIKSYHLLKHLARNHDITFVSFPVNHPGEENIRHLESLGIRVHFIVLKPLKAALTTALRLFKNLPLEIAFFTQPEGRRLIDELCKKEKFDLGIAFFMRTAEYIKHKTFKKILIAEDCRTMYQSRSFEASGTVKQKIVRWWEVLKLKKYEPGIVNFFDITTLVTQHDIAAMRDLNANVEYGLITNGTDIHHFKPQFSQEKRKGLLFFGKLDVYSNEMMVLKIIKEIFPKVKKEIPETVVNFAGADTPEYLLKLASPSIYFHKDVPDMQKFLHESAVFVHPHKGASGIQNKVLEAMATGCAVVTTPTGIQGIAAKHNEHVLIAKSDEEMAQYIIELLKNPELRVRLAKNARALIEREHSWEAVDRAVDATIARVFKK
ncbi:MAG TPA: glycosyltransferase [Patescibacteria group bacterium]|nr:glycosyltransferase [Patescibacteria group bacterium]